MSEHTNYVKVLSKELPKEFVVNTQWVGGYIYIYVWYGEDCVATIKPKLASTRMKMFGNKSEDIGDADEALSLIKDSIHYRHHMLLQRVEKIEALLNL